MRRRPRLTAKHAFTTWAVLVYLFLFLPIVVMAVFAFNKPSAAALAGFHGTNVCAIPPTQIGNIAVWNGFTGCWFSAGLHDPTFIPAIIVSLRIAAEASVIATVLGLCAALALARMRPRLRAPFDSLVYLTLVVPEIVIAVASLIFFVQARKVFPAFPGLGNVTILIGQVVFNASLTMLIIRARFVGMGDTLEEAAYDLGSGPLATFRQVTLPRLAPAIVAAALLSFTFSFDDYVLPAFTNGTTNTWPIVLYSAVRFGLTPAVNALATIMLGVTLAAVVVTALVLRRSRRRVTAGQRNTPQPALSRGRPSSRPPLIGVAGIRGGRRGCPGREPRAGPSDRAPVVVAADQGAHRPGVVDDAGLAGQRHRHRDARVTS